MSCFLCSKLMMLAHLLFVTTIDVYDVAGGGGRAQTTASSETGTWGGGTPGEVSQGSGSGSRSRAGEERVGKTRRADPSRTPEAFRRWWCRRGGGCLPWRWRLTRCQATAQTHNATYHYSSLSVLCQWECDTKHTRQRISLWHHHSGREHSWGPASRGTAAQDWSQSETGWVR